MQGASQSLHHTCFIHRSVRCAVEPAGIGLRGSTINLILQEYFFRIAHQLFSICSARAPQCFCGVRPYGVSFLFALMQKETKKSRAKYASPRIPSRHPAFGSGHRAGFLDKIQF